ncbi:MAG: diguanylate cyclase [Rhizobiaceae bacterium]
MKLRHTLIILLCLAAIAPISLFWFWPYSRALESEVDDVKERHLVIARNLAGEMEHYYTDLINIFDVIVGDINNGQLSEQFSNIFKAMNLRQICVLDYKTGLSRSSIQTTSEKCRRPMSASRFLELKSLAVEGKTKLSGVMSTEHYGNVIYAFRRKQDLLVVGLISTKYVQDLGRRISFGVRGHAAIVDQNGRAISHPRQDWQDNRFDMSKLSVVKKMLAGKTGVEIFYSPALKADMVAGYTSVKGAGWGVMVPQPISELKSKAQEIEKTAIFIMLFGLLAAVAAAIFASLTITRPLEHLVLAMREIGKGNYGDSRHLIQKRWMPAELVEAHQSTATMASNIKSNLDHTFRQTQLDHFTGIMNRETFMTSGPILVKSSLSEGQKGAVVSIDMNDTQKYNDFHGHKAVDVLIQRTANELGSLCKDFETFCRVTEPDIRFIAARTGGDKFTILIHGSTDSTTIAKFLTRMVSRICNKYELSNNLTLEATSSVGVAYFPHDSEVFEELIRLSETALSYSRNAGKGQIVNVCSVIRESLVAI